MLALVACTTPTPTVGNLSPEDREAYARSSLERVRAMRAAGELPQAERLLRSVIAVAPNHRRARVLHVQLLEEMGRDDEARSARHAARVLAAPPLPEGPSALASERLLVTIAAEELGDGGTAALAAALGGPVTRALAERVQVRLPEARVVRQIPGNLEEARRWLDHIQPRAVLALRVARGFCGHSLKDGAFAVTELQVAAGPAGCDELESFSLVERQFDPDPDACLEEVAARALEQALADDAVRATLASEAHEDREDWSAATVRSIFPGLDAAIESRAERGREAMESGRFAQALVLFREAMAIDPEDERLAGLLREAEATLAMQAELRGEPGTFVADVAAEAAASLAGGD